MNGTFKESILSTNIQLRPFEYNQSIDDILLEKLKKKVEGKCDKNGYIKPGSASIIKRSIGNLLQSQFNGNCTFKIWYKILCCNPVEGMVVKCSVLNRNKMGIFCELYNENPSPLTIILAKQHHLREERYEDIKVGSCIDVEIVGIKFEYNDTQISCIGRLYNKKGAPPLDDNEEEEYYKEEEEEEEEMEEEMEQEIIIPDVKSSSNNKSRNLIDLMTPSESVKEEDVGSGKVESHGSMINENPIDLNEVNLDQEDLKEKKDINNLGEDELGIDFKGAEMNLDAESEKNRENVYLSKEQENIKTINAKVYQKQVKDKPDPACYSIVEQSKNKRLKKNFITYYNYYLLNNMLFEYYEKNKCNPTTIYVNSNYQFKEDMIKLINAYLSHIKLEETIELTHVV